MNPQLVLKDGSVIMLDDEQLEQILSILTPPTPSSLPPLTPEEVEAILNEVESMEWGISTDELLEERRIERELERRREEKWS